MSDFFILYLCLHTFQKLFTFSIKDLQITEVQTRIISRLKNILYRLFYQFLKCKTN